MSQEQFKSAAFQNAELKSEHLRILAVLVFVAIFIILTTVRVFVVRTAAETTPWMWSYILASLVIGYELWTLHKVNLALRAGASLATRFWILSTILETSVPAWAIAFLTSQQIEAPYRALASPAVLVFFIFIILSTLRLSPWIAVLSGVVASITYLCAAWYLGWRIATPWCRSSRYSDHRHPECDYSPYRRGRGWRGRVSKYADMSRLLFRRQRPSGSWKLLNTICRWHDLSSNHFSPESNLRLMDSTLLAGISQPMIRAATFSIGRPCPMENWWSALPMLPVMVLGPHCSQHCATHTREAVSASPKIFPMLSNTFTRDLHLISHQADS